MGGKGKRRSYDGQSAGSRSCKGKGKGRDRPIGDPGQTAHGNFKGKGKGRDQQTGHSTAMSAEGIQQIPSQQQQQVVMVNGSWYPVPFVQPVYAPQQAGVFQGVPLQIAYDPRQMQMAWQNWQWRQQVGSSWPAPED